MMGGPQGEVLGRVVDEAGEPVRQFLLRLKGGDNGDLGGSKRVLSEQGRFALKNIPAGTYSLTVSWDLTTSPLTRDIVVRESTPTVVELSLPKEPAQRPSGHVLQEP